MRRYMRVCGPSARRWRSTYWRELPRDGTNGEHWSRLQHGGQNAKVSHTGARRAIEAAKVNVAIPSHRSRRLVPPAQDRGSTSFERPPAAIVRWTTKEKTAEPPLSLCASEMKILPIVPAPKTWRVQTSGPELLAAQTIDLRNSSNLSPRPDHRYSWTAHHAERQ